MDGPCRSPVYSQLTIYKQQSVTVCTILDGSFTMLPLISEQVIFATLLFLSTIAAATSAKSTSAPKKPLNVLFILIKGAKSTSF